MDTILYLDPGLDEPITAVPGKSNLQPEYMIVADAPRGRRTNRMEREPLGGRIHRFTRKVVDEFGRPVYLTELSKTPIDSRKKAPPIKDIRYWYPTFKAEVERIKPKRILALGAAVAKILCPGYKDLNEDHGTFFWNPELNTYVIPTYHFSQARRNSRVYPMLARDLERFDLLPPPAKPQYVIIEKVPFQFNRGTRVYFDIETTGLDPWKDKITMLGFKQRSAPVVSIVENPTPEQLQIFIQAVQASNATLVGHNMVFDLKFVMLNSGIEELSVNSSDTMLMAHMVGESLGLSLKHLTTMYTDRPGPRAFGGVTDAAYLAEDVLSTEAIDEYFGPKTNDAFMRKVTEELVPYLASMNLRGVRLHQKRLAKVQEEYVKRSERALRRLNKKAKVTDVNWNSTDQIAPVFLGAGIPLINRTPTGKYSITEAILTDLAKKFKLPELLLDYNEVSKQLEFLTDYTQRTSKEHPYIHPSMLLHTTRTGRTSCRDPNVQQVPRVGPIKTIYVSRFLKHGYWGLIDLSQAELRIAAIMSNDWDFAEMLMSGDAHRNVASIVFRKPPEEISAYERKKSKATTFGLLYGGTPRGLAIRNGVREQEIIEVQKILRGQFPVLLKWIEEMEDYALRTKTIASPLGRTRDVTHLFESEGANSVRRKAVNTPVQSMASDVMLMILCYTYRQCMQHRLRSRPMFGVHDSTMLDIYREEVDNVAMLVQEAFRYLGNTPLADFPLWEKIPLTGDLIVAPSWAQVESTNENYDKEKVLVYECSTLS